MNPLKNYKLLDGTTRQYHEGNQPEGAYEVAVAGGWETPESRAAKAPAKTAAKRRTSRKQAPKDGE